MGLSLLGNKELVQFWLALALKRADDPSRFVALRAPKHVSDRVRALLRPSRTFSSRSSRGCHRDKFLVLEIIAGCEEPSLGFWVSQPVEA